MKLGEYYVDNGIEEDKIVKIQSKLEFLDSVKFYSDLADHYNFQENIP